MNDVDRYSYNIERWITSGLRKNPRTFEELVRHLPSVDPILVQEELSSSSVYDKELTHTLLNDAQSLSAHLPKPHESPVPHPLDFDWRFGGSAVRELSQVAGRLDSSQGCIALIGAPTLAQAFLKQPSYELHLIDKNPLWQAALHDVNLHTLDVSKNPCPLSLFGKADLVIIDPPWYMKTYAHFMWFARQLLKPSGILAVSVLPIGTRPSAVNDRADLKLKASQFGFNFFEESTSVLGYATPPFERNALKAAGINAKLEEWRFADLWLFSADGDSTSVRPSGEDISNWSEISFAEVRIRFNMRANNGPMTLNQLVPGDVLPSVSTRFPGREKATVWTSGNRVFSCKNSAALHDFCLKETWRIGSGFEFSEVNTADTSSIEQLMRIIEQELLEYGNGKRRE